MPHHHQLRRIIINHHTVPQPLVPTLRLHPHRYLLFLLQHAYLRKRDTDVLLTLTFLVYGGWLYTMHERHIHIKCTTLRIVKRAIQRHLFCEILQVVWRLLRFLDLRFQLNLIGHHLGDHHVVLLPGRVILRQLRNCDIDVAFFITDASSQVGVFLVIGDQLQLLVYHLLIRVILRLCHNLDWIGKVYGVFWRVYLMWFFQVLKRARKKTLANAETFRVDADLFAKVRHFLYGLFPAHRLKRRLHRPLLTHQQLLFLILHHLLMRLNTLHRILLWLCLLRQRM